MTSIGPFPKQLLPVGSYAEIGRTSAEYIPELLAEERLAVARAHPKRLAEFATGRVLARRQLQRIGFGPHPLLVGPDRMPLWPRGAVGSISHSSDLCAVVAASTDRVIALGIDIEVAEPLEPELWTLVGTNDEMDHIAAALTMPDPGLAAKALFSVKEAAFKCWYPRARVLLEFTDAVVFRQSNVGNESLGISVRGVPYIHQPYGDLQVAVQGDFIFSAAWKVNLGSKGPEPSD